MLSESSELEVVENFRPKPTVQNTDGNTSPCFLDILSSLRFARPAALALGFLLCGCQVTTVLQLSNSTAAEVKVRTLHTGKSYSIAAHKSKDVEHTVGDVVVSSGEETRVTHVDVLTPAYRRVGIDGGNPFHRRIFFRSFVDQDLSIKVGRPVGRR